MADYPLKQIAEDVQKILDTALTVNNSYPQTLTEEEKAITREKIGASAIGEGIKIISHFDTLEELVSTITKPSAGDAYSVGTEIPYRLYVRDFLREEWRDYGPIRSTDIKARFAQNVAVSTSAWKADTDVFEDYTYKAQIPLGEVTGNDFPIVAFAPFDAVSGNYCPIAYSFDGYVEIWARAIPASAISIPAITFIIQDDGASGGSTKGITNASGGIATGGIGSEQIADKSITVDKVADSARTKTFYVTIPADWDGTNAPYSRSLAVDGILATDIPKAFFFAPANFADLEAQQEAFGMLYDVESANGTITFYAKEKPEVPFTAMIEVNRI
jgi:hypothetical protein